MLPILPHLPNREKSKKEIERESEIGDGFECRSVMPQPLVAEQFGEASETSMVKAAAPANGETLLQALSTRSGGEVIDGSLY